MLTPAPTLRTTALGHRLQLPSILSSSSFYTTATPHIPDSTSTRTSSYRSNVALPKSYSTSKGNPQVSIRCASTIGSPTNTPSPPTDTSQFSEPPLDWNSFFKLRKSRRWSQLGSSVTTSVAGVVVGAQIITNADMDTILSQLPLDPFIAMGLLTFTCGGMGWLVGPILGTAIFNVRNRRYKTQISEKETEFYRRIKKWRVDPSGGSAANPVPDYYGEKIGSVAGYREWLKDQRAFNRKRQNYI